MTELTLHSQSIKTVFDLLGSDENHMTFSLGWALARSRTFLISFATLMGIQGGFSEDVRLHLQEHQSGMGITDLEFIDLGRHHIIMEAKRGFTVPSLKQLSKYANRLNENHDPAARRLLVVLAESDRQERWLGRNLPPDVEGVPLKSISWQKFIAMAEKASNKATHTERRLLRELVQYLGEVTIMTNKNSNKVYVVALSDKTICRSPITLIAVVDKFKKYFHPVGGGTGGWPAEPPTTSAFVTMANYNQYITFAATRFSKMYSTIFRCRVLVVGVALTFFTTLVLPSNQRKRRLQMIQRVNM